MPFTPEQIATLGKTCKECSQPIQYRADHSKVWCGCDVRYGHDVNAGGAPLPHKWLAPVAADKPQLTAEQLAALRAFAADNGRTWKASLRDCWMTGNYRDYPGSADSASLHSAALQQVRNTFGPSWLIRFRLPQEVKG